jgi:hypothetical protein
MGLLPDVSFDIASAVICGVLIVCRCLYRLLFPCKLHPTCHRRWRVDDAYMALALIPLIVRTVTIVTSFILNPDHAGSPPTAEEAAASGLSVSQLASHWVVSRKLLIPSRLSYALFLWLLKLCLLTFYSRFVEPLSWGHTVIRTLWWLILATYASVLIATLTECRPLYHAWELTPPGESHECARGLANLLTMASFNIITDLALIILPFPMLRNIRLDRKAKIQLMILFGIGIIVVVITILRVPLILISSVSQRSRSMWASIEMLCACIVANTAFFYTVVKDLQGRHSHSQNAPSNNIHGANFYMQSLPSSSGYREDPVRPSSRQPKEGTVEHHDHHHHRTNGSDQDQESILDT